MNAIDNEESRRHCKEHDIRYGIVTRKSIHKVKSTYPGEGIKELTSHYSLGATQPETETNDCGRWTESGEQLKDTGSVPYTLHRKNLDRMAAIGFCPRASRTGDL